MPTIRNLPPEYPLSTEQHYVVATASGDGWESKGPLRQAIENDVASAEQDNVDCFDWIDSANVFQDDGDGTLHIAELRIQNRRWRWRTFDPPRIF